MLTLYWNYDSPYSRSIKWLLLKNDVAHSDVVLNWHQMTIDEALFNANPKRQVPTLVNGNESRCDSLLIALDYLPGNWHQSMDARLYRLADAEVEAAIIFLFRANAMLSRFGESENVQFMLDAGIQTYRFAIDLLIDNFWPQCQAEQSTVGVGAVLLHSTLLAARSMMPTQEHGYREVELAEFIEVVQSDDAYQFMVKEYQGQPDNQVSFVW